MKNNPRKFVLLGMLFISVTLVKAQNEKITASKTYVSKEIGHMESFEKIRIQGFVDVEYRQSSDTRISVYGSDNLIEWVDVKVSGEEMHVSFKKKLSVTGETRLKVIASSPALHEVSINGSADVHLRGRLQGNNLHLFISGSGDITADQLDYLAIRAEVKGSGDISLKKINCTSFHTFVQGSGDVTVNGTANNAELSVKGSGDIHAKSLTADQVTASVAGSGDIDCFAKIKLDAKVSGSGDIRYSGNPATVLKSGKEKQITKK